MQERFKCFNVNFGLRAFVGVLLKHTNIVLDTAYGIWYDVNEPRR